MERAMADIMASLRKFRLLDDTFMRECLQDNKLAVQLILRIILGKPDLEVQSMETQKDAVSLTGRGVRFDVWARDGDAVYNIEVERSDAESLRKRARYYSGMLDSGLLKTGEDYCMLVETYVIFITENDFFCKGQSVYQFDRYCRGIDQYLEDGAHILFVNGRYSGEDDIGRLMRSQK